MWDHSNTMLQSLFPNFSLFVTTESSNVIEIQFGMNLVVWNLHVLNTQHVQVNMEIACMRNTQKGAMKIQSVLMREKKLCNLRNWVNLKNANALWPAEILLTKCQSKKMFTQSRLIVKHYMNYLFRIQNMISILTKPNVIDWNI